jgi:hypothetical protein
MALFEISTTELVNLAKNELPPEIKKFKGTSSGFTFDYNIEHGIPLVPESLPFKVDFWGYEKEYLIFELTINKESKLINRVAGKIINMIANKFEEEFPEGISYEDGYVYLAVNDFLDEAEIEITSASLSKKLFHIEFKV